MDNRKKILLADADERFAEATKSYLEKNGFDVTLVQRGDAAVDRMHNDDFDLVILDYTLPVRDAKSICLALRAQFEHPILVVSDRNDDVDEIIMLEIGVDDYLVKSVSPRKLLAKMTNLIGRYERLVSSTKSLAPELDATLRLDIARRVALVDGKTISLSGSEFDLLRYFFANQGNILTRAEIYRQVNGDEWDGRDRSIDLRISRLRNKLGDTGKSPRFIKSIRGTGYMLIGETT